MNIFNMLEFIEKKSKDFFSGVLGSSLDQEDIRKILLLYFICAFGTVVLLIMASIAAYESNNLLAALDVFIALLLIGNLVFLHITGYFKQFIVITCTIVALFFIFLFWHGGVNNTAFVWYYTFPLFSLFVLGRHLGLILNLFLLLGAILFFIISPEGPFFANYSKDLAIRFIVSFITTFSFAYIFEYLRETTHEKLIAIQRELENKVKKRTAKLHEANEHLVDEIKQKKQAEKTLQQLNNLLITILDSIDANIFVASTADYKILFVNKSMQKFYGDDLLGRPCWEVIWSRSEPCEDCIIHDLEDFGKDEVQITEKFHEGYGKWFLFYERIIKWIDGQDVLLSMAVDQTERIQAQKELQDLRGHLERQVAERTEELKRRNKELEQEITVRRRVEQELATARDKAEMANRAKSEFLANMSHELRTPLNHIIGFTELIVDKHFGPLTKQQEEFLEDVLKSSRHLLSLINDILDLSKVEAGKFELEPETLNLSELFEECIGLLKEKCFKHGIQVELNMSDNLPLKIIADGRKIKQIMFNLLSNAAKFTDDGGKISIFVRSLTIDELERLKEQISTSYCKDLKRHDEYLWVSVKDTGIGIEKDQLDLIFEPFEQAAQPGKYQGTGLGLSLTKNLVKIHNGCVWANSEGKGLGSTFHFIIPLIRANNP